MPCRDGGPPTQVYKSSVFNIPTPSEVEAMENKINNLTALLCEVLTTLEEKAPEYIDCPDVRNWWEQHKEDDRIRTEEEKEKFLVALASAKEASIQRKKYFKYLIDPDLDQDDKNHFSTRMQKMTEKIQQHIRNFPEIENYVSIRNPRQDDL